MSGETCEDGNKVSNDGCSSDCTKLETGFKCLVGVTPLKCTPICGDGLVVGTEKCDGAGCLSDCSGPAAGFTCTVTSGKSDCNIATCGDCQL